MDDRPPPYEASDSRQSPDSKSGSHNYATSLADEVTIYRSQHVAATASKVQDALESRARYGMSKTTLLLVPDGQIGNKLQGTRGEPLNDDTLDLSKGYEVVELEDVKFTLIELKGETDSVEFWSQPQTVQELRGRITDGTNGGRTGGSNTIKANVSLEEYHFRSESVFGLMETVATMCIIVIFEA